MALESLRKEVWKCNLDLPKNGLVKMTSGNVSGRDPETGLVVIKPSGYSYEDLTPADMVIVNLEGDVVEGHLKPSVDTATHLYIYRHRPTCLVWLMPIHPMPPVSLPGRSDSACLTTGHVMAKSSRGYVPIGGEAR
jgi:ribulose-5-phosphate 4-epimerase/fuculose-1-phosphate aldolase